MQAGTQLVVDSWVRECVRAVSLGDGWVGVGRKQVSGGDRALKIEPKWIRRVGK